MSCQLINFVCKIEDIFSLRLSFFSISSLSPSHLIPCSVFEILHRTLPLITNLLFFPSSAIFLKGLPNKSVKLHQPCTGQQHHFARSSFCIAQCLTQKLTDQFQFEEIPIKLERVIINESIDPCNVVYKCCIQKLHN